MVRETQKPELLAPAGTLDILKIAFLYGADAVYCGTPDFAMRSRVGFNLESLEEGIDYAHSIGKKVYVTLNAFPHAGQIDELKKHIVKLAKLSPDAFIIADPGVLNYVKDNFDIPIHLSTQSNTTNQLSAGFWQKQGIERLVLARELNIEDIKLIHKSVPNLELEAFVHGAMCMAYSGRCQISNYMTGRDPNKGECIQACRFKYKMYALEEELRPGEKFPIFEDEEGSHILNSKDLSMIEHIGDLVDAGIISFKIEGRLKSEYYVAAVVRAWREAIDLYFKNKAKYEKNKHKFTEEICKTANRGLTTGFYFGKPNEETNNYASAKTKSEWGYIGRVISYDNESKLVKLEAKNYLPIKSKLEIITNNKMYKLKLDTMLQNGQPIDLTHAGNIIEIPFEYEIAKDSLIRIKL